MDSFIGRYYILFYIQFTYTINEHSESKGLDEIKTKMAIQDDFCLTSSTSLTIIAISVLCMYLFVVNLKSHVKIDEISTMKIVLILVILFLFLLVSSLVEEGEKQNKCFRPSKMSCRESASVTSSSPPVSQETLLVKEKFIPPELSIWDYFIAKVIQMLSK